MTPFPGRLFWAYRVIVFTLVQDLRLNGTVKPTVSGHAAVQLRYTREATWLHSRDYLLHSRATCLHSRGYLLHSRATCLHSRGYLLHSRATWPHSPATLLHSRATCLHSRGYFATLASYLLHSIRQFLKKGVWLCTLHSRT